MFRIVALNDMASERKIVAVSIGVATASPRHGAGREALLIRDADAALCRAQEEGRNMIRAGNVTPADFEWQIVRAG